MIERLAPDEARQWFAQLPAERRFATQSPDYALADSARSTDVEVVFLGHREGDSIWLHGVHRSAVPGLDCVDQQSPYGYGGPVSNSNDPQFLARAWCEYVRGCQRDGVLAEFVRLHPLAARWQAYGGEIQGDRLTVAVDLTHGDLRGTYTVRCRTAVRKAEKSRLEVTICDNAVIPIRFAQMYRDAMAAIGADAFYLFNEPYFHEVARLPGIRLLVAHLDGEWLSAGLFLTAGITMEYHLSATTEMGRRLAATNLLLDTAARIGKSEDLRNFYLGGGTDSRPDNPLLFFKSGFSQLTVPYSIGYTVFQPDRYRRLQDEYRTRGLAVTRVLFYRG